MVHALEKVHGLLAPGGRLIDIHPPTERARFQVRVGTRLFHAGWMRETDEGIEYRNAERALKMAVSSGLFVVERQGSFEFLHHARTLDRLRQHLSETWSDAIIDDEVALRVETLLRRARGRGEVILRETARIRRLRPRSSSLLLRVPDCLREGDPLVRP